MTSDAPVVHAAGGVLWRDSPHGSQIALVHRPRYDDWSLPKGKRKAGEQLLVTAVREVQEETGHLPHLGPFLARCSYPVTVDGRPAIKVVKYWAMADAGGRFAPNDEVDEILWLGVEEAAARTQFPVDRTVLRAFAALPDATSTLIVIRNASAARSSRTQRGLDRRGQARADALIPVLRGLGINRLLSTPALRCLDTLAPYATDSGLAVDAQLADAAGAGLARRLLDLAGSGQRVALCADGATLARLVPALTEGGGLTPRSGPAIKKGSWRLMHVADGQLLSIEAEEEAAA